MDNLKNYLYGVSIIAIVVFAVIAISFATNYSRSVSASSQSFTVTAQGTEVTEPDSAKFNFSVVNQGQNIVALKDENARRVNQVTQYLKDQGVKEENIKTVNYHISPTYDSEGRRAPEIVGYQINQTNSVKLDTLENIEEIVSGTVENGANQVTNLSLAVDEPKEILNAAREKAIENAKEKARDLAQAGNFRLGQLLSISESSDHGRPIPLYGRGGAEHTHGTPDISPGTNEFTVNVSLRYSIK